MEDTTTWRAGLEPRLDIGRWDGEAPYLFEDVQHAARLGDGRVAVLESGAHEVRLFDAEGVHLRTLGRSGDGPGEFRSPLRFWPRGDSLVVYDWSGSRVTLLPLDGSPARTLVPAGLARAYNAQVWLAGDRLIVPVKAPPPPMDQTDPTEVVISYVAVPLDGSPPDTMVRLSGGLQRRVEFTVGGQTMITADVSPALFQAIPQAAAADRHLWAASGRRPAVRRFAPDGALDMEIRWREPGRPTTDGLLERHIEHRAADSDDPDRIREMFRQQPVADSLPYFDGLIVDEAGRLWVKRFEAAPDGGVHRWTIYGPDGARVAAAEVPTELTVFQVGDDWILGVRRDELEVPHVVLLPLEKGGA